MRLGSITLSDTEFRYNVGLFPYWPTIRHVLSQAIHVKRSYLSAAWDFQLELISRSPQDSRNTLLKFSLRDLLIFFRSSNTDMFVLSSDIHDIFMGSATWSTEGLDGVQICDALWFVRALFV